MFSLYGEARFKSVYVFMCKSHKSKMHHEEGGRNLERQREDNGEKQKWRLAGRREETSCRGRDRGSEEEMRTKEDDIHV